jgi:hypothetical protein
VRCVGRVRYGWVRLAQNGTAPGMASWSSRLGRNRAGGERRSGSGRGRVRRSSWVGASRHVKGGGASPAGFVGWGELGVEREGTSGKAGKGRHVVKGGQGGKARGSVSAWNGPAWRGSSMRDGLRGRVNEGRGQGRCVSVARPGWDRLVGTGRYRPMG